VVKENIKKEETEELKRNLPRTELCSGAGFEAAGAKVELK
jgi:ribosomal protein L7/L12